jgi:hypothetical protein
MAMDGLGGQSRHGHRHVGDGKRRHDGIVVRGSEDIDIIIFAELQKKLQKKREKEKRREKNETKTEQRRLPNERG